MLKLNEKLKRPNNYLDCLTINIYQELIEYLKGISFSGDTLFDIIMNMEKEDPVKAQSFIRDEVNNRGFYPHLEKKIKEYFQDKSSKRVYLIIHGFGSAYPYLRASEMLKKTERLIKEFKMILFYPGGYSNQRYSLFNLLDDDHMYRANHLNALLSENIA